MISILTGLPRSGKSYRAVWFIDKTFLDPKSPTFKKHRYLYTNIGGFKFDLINERLGHDPVVDDNEAYIKETIYLDWDLFYKHVQKLHEMALSDKPDEELLRYAEYHKLSPALIVIDEAYRYYKKKSDPVLVWLNGYHGHLGLDLVFIIHKPTMMNSDYVAHTEEFIDAQPKSKSLSNNQFRYHFYATTSYTKDSKYHTEKLKADPAIFALYKSGDLHNPKKILYKFIVYIVLSSIFIIFMGYTFYSRMHDKVKLDTNTTAENPFSSSAPVANTFNAPSQTAIASDYMTLTVRCDNEYCARVDPTMETHYVPKVYFEELLKTVQYKQISVIERRIFYSVYYDYLYVLPLDFLRFFPLWTMPKVDPQNMPSPSLSSKPLDGVT